MRIKHVLFPALIGIFFLPACKRNAVNLEYTNAKGEVPQLSNLIFRFNKSLVKDSMLNAWDSTDYISFEPKIPGRFRWESPDQLVFSPSQPLLPATNYKAKIRNEILRHSKYDKVSGSDKINFNTPPLTLDNVQVIWMLQDESNRIPVAQMDLFFNYRVNPKDLKEKLKIEVDGKKEEFDLQTVSPDNKISLRIINLKTDKADEKEFETKIIIARGLSPENGRNSTSESIEQTITVSSPYILTIQNVESDHDGTEGTIRITTNQQLAGESLKSYIKFDPDLNYTAELNETGLVIRSDKFDKEKSYAVTFLKNLRGKIGGVLKEDATHQVAFGELEAGISFSNSKAVYLSRRGAQNIEVKITSVPKVKLVISKIYESNLLMAQRYDYYPKETTRFSSFGEGDEDIYYYEESSDISLGDVIYEKEIDTRSLPKSGGGRLLNIAQFEDRLPDFKGIYHIMIRSASDYWVKDSRYISLSDIGLIVKEGQEKICVFANSIKTADAMKGVEVMIYSGNNQLIGTGSTNNKGLVEIEYTKKDFGSFRPAMIIAKTADDFNYLPFRSTQINTSRFDVGGKRNNSTGLDAFIYAERDIYRPGEKVNFSVILRDREWKSPGDIPLKMKFLLPNGRELKSFRKTLNEEGSLEGSIDITTAAITGSYTLEVYTSNDVLLASKDFSIEEFVPDRIKVNVKPDKNYLRVGEAVNLSINALNFFGPPAANRNYEIEIQVKQKYFSPAKFKDYNFSLANQTSFTDKKNNAGKTDDNGNAAEVFAVPDTYKDRGLLQANFYTTVFDETGRPVSRNTTLDIFTQDIFYGIKNDGWYYHPLNQPIKFLLAAVNKDGNAVNANAEVHVIKHEYNTVLTKSGEMFRYESQETEKLMIENKINVGANSSYMYVPRSPGRYELRVFRPGANTYVSKSFYSYGNWGWGDNGAFEVSSEGNVDIELDKDSYLAGEKVKALFKTPFSGRMLVTMETDKVISSEYINVDKRSASLDLKLTGEHVPNVYITATLIKPHEVSDIPLTVAHGFKNVKVEEKSRKIPVEINAPKTVRSKTQQKITVKAVAGSLITLAAVDNGVLQVTDFKTPDPYNYFYQKKALQVTAYDLYPLLFPEMRARLSSTRSEERRVGKECRTRWWAYH